jgi:hypothetical protein
VPGQRDSHFNVFHAYRGAAPDEAVRRRQLEDNLTRALGIVLVHLAHDGLAAPILEQLGVDPPLREKPFTVGFQVAPSSLESGMTPRWPKPEKRKLIAFLTDDRLADQVRDHASAPVTGSARADMVLFWDNAALVIESELTPQPDVDQMERLRKAFSTTSEWQTTWGRLAHAARRVTPRDQVAQFITTQFEEYLRMNGFGGFADEHFAYFAWSPERRRTEPVTKLGAQRALRGLLDELRSRWGVQWQARIGKLGEKDRGLWGKLEPDGGTAPHLSVFISTNGLTIFANIETQGPFRQFRAAWRERRAELLAILQELGDDFPHREKDPWIFAVHRRVQQTAPGTGKPLPRRFWDLPAFSVAASTLTNSPEIAASVIDEALRLVDLGEPAPEILIQRHYDVWQAVSDTFVDSLVSDAQQLEPFFAWVGEKPR